MHITEKKISGFLILCFILALAFFHYGTPAHFMYLHLVLQALFFAPVVLAGLWFGRTGGLVAAAAIFLLYVYHAVTVMMPTPELAVGNTVQIILLFVAGYFSGIHAGSRHSPVHPPEKQKPKQKLLFYVNDPLATANAIPGISLLFGGRPDINIILFGVLNVPQEDSFFLSDSQCKLHQHVLHSVQETAARARELLLQRGFSEENLSVRFVNSPDGRTSDILLNELQSAGYTAMIVGRQDLKNPDSCSAGIATLAKRTNCPILVT